MSTTKTCPGCDGTGEHPHPAVGAREGGDVLCLDCGGTGRKATITMAKTTKPTPDTTPAMCPATRPLADGGRLLPQAKTQSVDELKAQHKRLTAEDPVKRRPIPGMADALALSVELLTKEEEEAAADRQPEFTEERAKAIGADLSAMTKEQIGKLMDNGDKCIGCGYVFDVGMMGERRQITDKGSLCGECHKPGMAVNKSDNPLDIDALPKDEPGFGIRDRIGVMHPARQPEKVPGAARVEDSLEVTTLKAAILVPCSVCGARPRLDLSKRLAHCKISGCTELGIAVTFDGWNERHRQKPLSDTAPGGYIPSHWERRYNDVCGRVAELEGDLELANAKIREIELDADAHVGELMAHIRIMADEIKRLRGVDKARSAVMDQTAAEVNKLRADIVLAAVRSNAEITDLKARVTNTVDSLREACDREDALQATTCKLNAALDAQLEVDEVRRATMESAQATQAATEGAVEILTEDLSEVRQALATERKLHHGDHEVLEIVTGRPDAHMWDKRRAMEWAEGQQVKLIEAQSHSREASQILIEEIGAPGPEGVNTTAVRAVTEIKRLKVLVKERDTYKAEIGQLQSRIAASDKENLRLGRLALGIQTERDALKADAPVYRAKCFHCEEASSHGTPADRDKAGLAHMAECEGHPQRKAEKLQVELAESDRRIEFIQATAEYWKGATRRADKLIAEARGHARGLRAERDEVVEELRAIKEAMGPTQEQRLTERRRETGESMQPGSLRDNLKAAEGRIAELQPERDAALADLSASEAAADSLGAELADVNTHAILISGVVPNGCPDREKLVERIQAIGAKDQEPEQRRIPPISDNVAQARKAILAGSYAAAMGWITDEVEKLGKHATGTHPGPAPHITMPSGLEDLAETIEGINKMAHDMKTHIPDSTPGPQKISPPSCRCTITPNVTLAEDEVAYMGEADIKIDGAGVLAAPKPIWANSLLPNTGSVGDMLMEIQQLEPGVWWWGAGRDIRRGVWMEAGTKLTEKRAIEAAEAAALKLWSKPNGVDSPDPS